MDQSPVQLGRKNSTASPEYTITLNSDEESNAIPLLPENERIDVSFSGLKYDVEIKAK